MKSLKVFRFTETFMRLHEIRISSIKVKIQRQYIDKTSISEYGPVGTGKTETVIDSCSISPITFLFRFQ